MTVNCEADGGQPQPSLHLKLNGDSLAVAEPSTGRPAVVSYSFEAKPAHHGAKLTCEAINSVMEAAVEAEPLNLEVLCKFVLLLLLLY